MSEMDNATYDGVETVDSSESDDLDLDEFDIEAPEADAAEQHTLVRKDTERQATRIPFDADEADAAEQSRVVELDEDDYR